MKTILSDLAEINRRLATTDAAPGYLQGARMFRVWASVCYEKVCSLFVLGLVAGLGWTMMCLGERMAASVFGPESAIAGILGGIGLLAQLVLGIVVVAGAVRAAAGLGFLALSWSVNSGLLVLGSLLGRNRRERAPCAGWVQIGVVRGR